MDGFIRQSGESFSTAFNSLIAISCQGESNRKGKDIKDIYPIRLIKLAAGLLSLFALFSLLLFLE
jgi:hypothetical protein